MSNKVMKNATIRMHILDDARSLTISFKLLKVPLMRLLPVSKRLSYAGHKQRQ